MIDIATQYLTNFIFMAVAFHVFDLIWKDFKADKVRLGFVLVAAAVAMIWS